MLILEQIHEKQEMLQKDVSCGFMKWDLWTLWK